MRFYRCFEWTLGADGCGHPHLHVWIFSPFLPEHDTHGDLARPRYQHGVCPYSRPGMHGPCGHCESGKRRRRGVRSWWADALRAEGVDASPADVNVTLRHVFVRAIEFIREVRKPNGVVTQRRELRIQTEDGGGLVRYFEPWCLAAVDPETGESATDDVLAAVYKALEARRLSQGSKGFLGLADDERAGCPCCGAVGAVKVSVESWQDREWYRPPPEPGAEVIPIVPVAPAQSTASYDPEIFRAAVEDAKTTYYRRHHEGWRGFGPKG